MDHTTSQQVVNLNDAARMNRETGMLLATKELLVTAIQDRRVLRNHLRVLACIAGFMNNGTGKAWPGRAGIAAMLGYSTKTVSNLLLDLRNFGYLLAERERVPEADNRSLLVYTWGKIDHETIRREIDKYIQGVRAGTIPARHHSDESPRRQGLSKSPPTGTSEKSSPIGTSKSLPEGTSELKVPAGEARKSLPAGDSNSYKELEDKRAVSANYWHQQLNPGSPDYAVAENGVVLLTGGARVSWLEKFGDEETLNLALGQASQYVQPNNGKPLSIQIEGQLSRILLDMRGKDRRYNARVATNSPPASNNQSRRERIRQAVQEAEEETRGRK